MIILVSGWKYFKDFSIKPNIAYLQTTSTITGFYTRLYTYRKKYII